MTLFPWLALSFVFPQGSGTPPRYRLIELAPEPTHGQALDVNERRSVVGTLDPDGIGPIGQHAWLWSPDGSSLDLTPGANYDYGYAFSISNAGVVVGDVDTVDATREGAYRWSGGVLEFLPTRYQSEARHVDERGHVAGSAHSASFVFVPTIWAPDLSYVQLPGLGGGNGVIQDRNGWGDSVGYDMRSLLGTTWHAFDVRDGVVRDLGALPGHVGSLALATSVERVSVGSSGPVLGEHAVRWLADGTIEPLARRGTGGSMARDINDRGEIVGYGTGRNGRFAILWLDGVGHSLEDLVDGLAGRRLLGAEGINERGDIVGYVTPPGGGLMRPFLALRTDGGHAAVIGPTPARAGGSSTFELVGLTPDAPVALYLGLRHGSTPVAGCGSLTVEIKNPRVLYAVADAAGVARFDVSLPPAVAGKHVLAQAVEPGRCRTTSLSVTQLD